MGGDHVTGPFASSLEIARRFDCLWTGFRGRGTLAMGPEGRAFAQHHESDHHRTSTVRAYLNQTFTAVATIPARREPSHKSNSRTLILCMTVSHADWLKRVLRQGLGLWTFRVFLAVGTPVPPHEFIVASTFVLRSPVFREGRTAIHGWNCPAKQHQGAHFSTVARARAATAADIIRPRLSEPAH